MRIILANPRGFCAGVNMAIDVVNETLRVKGPPIYVFHEIVHNRHVVEDFRDRGVVFVDELEQVPDGAVIVYSAHGISPTVRRRSAQKHLIEVDATCPLVTKVHKEVVRFAREKYTIIFIGHANHDEAVGTLGEAPESIVLVETAEDVARLELSPTDHLAYVTQTTLSLDDAARVITALKLRFPNIKAPVKEDICYATTNRQAAVSELSALADIVLVVGSRNSSNSVRLVETAKARGKSAYLIDHASEIDPAWLGGKRAALITAGASAPERLVQGVIERLRREFGGEVEDHTVVQEDVAFDMPRSVKRLAVLAS